MRLLLSNDDGIDAPGLAALEHAVAPYGEVWVVAPADEQSAKSHSLTMHRPLRLLRRGERRIAVTGTPADAVYVALHHLLPSPPDLVISGINRGSNLGYDVHYSGTVAAAREACLHGVSAVAVSAHIDDGPPEYGTAVAVITSVLERIRDELPLAAGVYLNVNAPQVPPEALRGIRAARLGHRLYDAGVDLRQDPRGKPYLWIGGPHRGFRGEPDADGPLIDAGYATVTPLDADPTDHRSLETLRDWFNR